MLRRALAVVVLLVVLAAGWVGVRGALAVRHLDAAAAAVPDLQQQLADLDVAAAEGTARGIRRETSDARDLTSDPVWRLAGAFPFGGQNLRAVGTGAAVADDLATDGMPAAVDAVTAVTALRGGLGDGDIEGSADGAADLSSALTDLQRARDGARADLDALDRRYLVQPVDDALAELEASLTLADGLLAGGGT